MTAPGDFFNMESTNSSPNVSRTFGDVHKSLIGTLCSRIQGAHGPIPEPVATNTRRRKRGTIRSTPNVGAPLTQRVDGGLSICFAVQSPALLTTNENPLLPGFVTVANPCHSNKGLSDIRMKLPGIGVPSMFNGISRDHTVHLQWSKCIRTACLESTSLRTYTSLRRIQGRIIEPEMIRQM